jgi:hypothetical protein
MKFQCIRTFTHAHFCLLGSIFCMSVYHSLGTCLFFVQGLDVVRTLVLLCTLVDIVLVLVQVFKVVHEFYTCCLFKCLRSSIHVRLYTCLGTCTLVVCSSV